MQLMCVFVFARQKAGFLMMQLNFVVSVISHFGFEDMNLVSTTPVPGHCLFVSL